jgi:hypothetical protein
MTPEQKLGLGALMLIGAIVVGYIVRCVVPARHYPRTGGFLAANASIAGLTVAGVEPAAHMIFWVAVASLYPAGIWAIEEDGKDRRGLG